MTDVDVLAECLRAALAELLDSVPAHRKKARAKPLVSPSVEAAANPRPRRLPSGTAPEVAAGGSVAAEVVEPRPGAPVPVAPKPAAMKPVEVKPVATAPEAPAVGVEPTAVRPQQVSSAASRGLVGRPRAVPRRTTE